MDEEGREDLDEDYDLVYQWREVLEKYRKENGGVERILMTEGSGRLEKIIQAYGDGKRNGAQIPFNFYFMGNINKNSKASVYDNLIKTYLGKIPAGYQANWVVRKLSKKNIAFISTTYAEFCFLLFDEFSSWVIMMLNEYRIVLAEIEGIYTIFY